MENSLTQRRKGLHEKIPDIRKTLSMVRFLQDQQKPNDADEDGLEDDADAEDQPKTIRTTFELNETLYAEADIKPSDSVYLWLGVSARSCLRIGFPLD